MPYIHTQLLIVIAILIAWFMRKCYSQESKFQNNFHCKTKLWFSRKQNLKDDSCKIKIKNWRPKWSFENKNVKLWKLHFSLNYLNRYFQHKIKQSIDLPWFVAVHVLCTNNVHNALRIKINKKRKDLVKTVRLIFP